MSGYTLREAAQALGVSVVTIRRYIKSGKLKARLVPSKFGESYVIEDLPLPTRPLSDDTQQIQPLINRVEHYRRKSATGKPKQNCLSSDYCSWKALSKPLGKDGGKGYSGRGTE